MLKKLLLAVMLIFQATTFAGSDRPCLNPFSTIDWSFIFDESEMDFKVCRCNMDKVSLCLGFQFRLAEPIAMMEVTNKPWNFPCVGIDIGSISDKQGNSQDKGKGGFRHSHFIIYPVLSILNFPQEWICFEKFHALRFLNVSEIRPEKNSDLLAMFVYSPDSIIYANPIAQLAGLPDCIASTAGRPINSIHWMAGCQGDIGTSTNFIQASNPVCEAALIATRDLNSMHFSYQLTKTSNASGSFGIDDGALTNSMCMEKYFPRIIKTQYFLQIAYPAVGEPEPIGMNCLAWEMLKNRVETKDDFVFVLWRIRDFCAGCYKCESTFSTN